MADDTTNGTTEPTAPEVVEPAAVEAPAAAAAEPAVEATDAAHVVEVAEPETAEAPVQEASADEKLVAQEAAPAEAAVASEPVATEPEIPAENEPIQATIDLAKDARYTATGKRKRAIARVILKPGNGTITVNGREFNEYFPRPVQQVTARLPLTLVGYDGKMDVIARIHGGGTSAQAGALRHGISRALTEASPSMRGELKRRGLLTRDSRVKERKKAGLKKARKRPQFSKR